MVFAVAAPVVAQSGWVQRLPAHSPPARAWHGLAFDVQRGVHVLFGGLDASYTPRADTWQWDGLDWQQLAPVNTPPMRYRHAMAWDLIRGRITLFGGDHGNTTALGDTWEFDGVDWAQRLPAPSPAARTAAGMAFSLARGRVILFGGQAQPIGQALQDTWEWDGTNWTSLATVHVPSARSGFGMTSDFASGDVYLFGGWSGNAGLSDAWSFDGVDWTQLSETQVPLPVRTDTTLAADLTHGMLVQFGGFLYPANQYVNDTWLHDGSDWRRDARPTAITPRSAFGLSYDWLRDCAVLFGGFNFSYFGETWEYSLTGVALWSVSGSGCAGTQGVPQLRPGGPQRAIVGTIHVLEVTGGVTGGAVFGLGLSNKYWNGTPLPLPLGAFGMPGCDLYIALDVLSFAAAVGGAAQHALAIPNDPGLVGVRFFAQALVPQPGVNAFGAVMSNAVAEVVGAF